MTADARIDRPVFIIGCARSGTTLLYNLLAAHPAFCWFSYVSDGAPGVRGVVGRHRWLRLPLVGPAQRRAIASGRARRRGGIGRVRMHWLPWPYEGDNTWHVHAGFGSEPYGVETVFTAEMETRLKGAMRLHLDVTGAPRFLSKQTANNRRLELIHRMFPDARVVHIVRDGRAVAASLVREPWWQDMTVWWLGKRVREYEGDTLELAARYWEATVNEIERCRALFGNGFSEITYEALTADPAGAVEQLLAFCDVPPRADHVAMLPASLPNRSSGWRMRLSAEEQRMIAGVIATTLARYGYGAE